MHGLPPLGNTAVSVPLRWSTQLSKAPRPHSYGKHLYKGNTCII